ncbi:MAG: hypothetical protein IPO29_01960 [Anaerolineae bacterium]|nr:hypothetical protein [Anaerolineae bacterium]HQY24745.1 hypothetical protein [Thermoflexales bacterium]
MTSLTLIEAERRLAGHPIGARRSDLWLPLAWLAETAVCVAAWPAGADPVERVGVPIALLGAQVFNFSVAWHLADARDPQTRAVKQASEAAAFAGTVARGGLWLAARLGPGLWGIALLLALCGIAWAIEGVLASHRAGRHPYSHAPRVTPASPRPAAATCWESSWRSDHALAPSCVAAAVAGWPMGRLAAGDALLSGLLALLGLVMGGLWWLCALRLSVTLLYRAGLNASLALQGELR